MDWEKLYQAYYNQYPDDNFWQWVMSQSPEGFNIPLADKYRPGAADASIEANLANFYNTYQQNPTQQIATPGYAPAYLSPQEIFELQGLSPLEASLSARYLREFPVAMNQYAQSVLADPDATEKEKAQAQYTIDNMAQITAQLQTALMDGGVAGYSVGKFENTWGSAVGDELRVTLSERFYASPTVQVGDATYKLVDGIFYDTRGNRMSTEAQETLSKNYELGQFNQSEAQRLADERAYSLANEKRAYQARIKEWGNVSNSPWLLSPDETTRRPWDPSVRERQIPEAMWNNPTFQRAYQQALTELDPTELYPATKGMEFPDTLQGKQAEIRANLNIPESTQLHTEQLARNRAMEQVVNPANQSMTARAAVQNAPQQMSYAQRGGGWGPTRAELRAKEAAKKKQAAEWNALVQKALQAANKPREFAIL